MDKAKDTGDLSSIEALAGQLDSMAFKTHNYSKASSSANLTATAASTDEIHPMELERKDQALFDQVQQLRQIQSEGEETLKLVNLYKSRRDEEASAVRENTLLLEQKRLELERLKEKLLALSSENMDAEDIALNLDDIDREFVNITKDLQCVELDDTEESYSYDELMERLNASSNLSSSHPRIEALESEEKEGASAAEEDEIEFSSHALVPASDGPNQSHLDSIYSMMDSNAEKAKSMSVSIESNIDVGVLMMRG